MRLQLRRGWGSEQSELAVVHGLLSRIGENGPSVMDEGERVTGEGEGVPMRVEEECETAVLGGDVVDVGGVAEDLEDPVPVAVVVVDP